MEKNNYSGAELNQLIKKSGLKVEAVAEKLGWNYMKLYRLLQNETLPEAKVKPILILIGELHEEENFDYKKEYFLLKSKYENLINAINSAISAPIVGTDSGQN
jgi:predicted transcriptional regulator